MESLSQQTIGKATVIHQDANDAGQVEAAQEPRKKPPGKPQDELVHERIINSVLRYDGIDDVDTITYEESEKRIIGCELVSAFIFGLVATILVAFYHDPVLRFNHLQVIQPGSPLKEESSYQVGFPVPHVALIYEDGSVFDISLYNQVSPSRNFLFKLSQDKAYFGYVEELEVLHFISSTIARKITRYHDPFGHQTIPQSVPKAIHRDDSYYTHGLRMGNKFWVWGASYKNEQLFDLPVRPQTYLWYIKRQKWRRGPIMPPDFIFYLEKPTTSTAINQSHVLIVSRSDWKSDGFLHGFVYDFEREKWTLYPSVTSDILYPDHTFLQHCSLATLISKNEDQKVFLSCLVIHINEMGVELQFLRSQMILLSYNLTPGNAGEWVFETQTEMNHHYQCKFIVLF